MRQFVRSEAQEASHSRNLAIIVVSCEPARASHGPKHRGQVTLESGNTILRGEPARASYDSEHVVERLYIHQLYEDAFTFVSSSLVGEICTLENMARRYFG